MLAQIAKVCSLIAGDNYSFAVTNQMNGPYLSNFYFTSSHFSITSATDECTFKENTLVSS
jgi:hypothetical protein